MILAWAILAVLPVELPVEPRAARTNPPPAAVAQSDAVEVSLDLLDGSRIVGQIQPRSLPVILRSEALGEVKIPLERVRFVQFGGTNQPAVVSLQNGDKLQGGCGPDEFGLITSFGKISIPARLLKRLTVAPAAAAGRIPDGCVLRLSFDVDEGERVSDSSGRGHQGQVRGAEYVAAGKRGGAYRFSNGDKQMWLPHHPDWVLGDRAFSIMLWVKLDQLPDEQREAFMLGHDEAAGAARKWGFEFFRDSLCFHTNGPGMGGGYRIARHRFRPEVNRWYHLALTREDSRYRLYVDGQLVKTDEHRAPVPEAAADLTIGQAEGLGINGMLDEVLLFHRALATEEIQALYESQK
jgi:hypothetical protein